MGHPEEETELDTLMLDWDVKSRGFLDFDAFLSIISTTLKAEEVQVQIENDFKRFDPNFDHRTKQSHDLEEIDREADELLHYRITKDDLMRVYEDLNIELTAEIAEEMLFDAGSDETGVSYDDLIRYVAHKNVNLFRNVFRY